MTEWLVEIDPGYNVGEELRKDQVPNDKLKRGTLLTF
jgi:hypothetical protein